MSPILQKLLFVHGPRIAGGLAVVVGLLSLFRALGGGLPLAGLALPLHGAVAHIAAGSGLLALTYGARRLATVAAGGTLLVGLFILAAATPYPLSTPQAQTIPGWGAIPSGGVVFLCLGLGLLALSRRDRRCCGYIAGLFGSGAVILAAFALFDFLVLDLHSLYPWWPFAMMRPMGAATLLLLGLGVIARAHHRLASELVQILSWVGLVSVISLAVLTLFMWSVLQRSEERSITDLVDVQTNRLAEVFRTSLNERVNAVERMAVRWEVAGGTSKRLWLIDADGYLADMPGGFIGLRWLDPEGRVRWAAPRADAERIVGFDHSADLFRAHALQRARNNPGRTIFSDPTRLLLGGQGIFLIRALLVDGEHDGYLLGVFGIDQLMADLTRTVVDRGYELDVRYRDKVLYRTAPPPALVDDRSRVHEIGFTLGGGEWQVRLWPSVAMLVEHSSPFPTVVLSGGLLLALLMGILFWIWQQSRVREVEARMAREQVARLFEVLPDGVLTLDIKTLRPVTFNAAAHRQIGYSSEEFRTLPLSAYLMDSSPEETQRKCEDILRHGRDDFEVIYRRRDGSHLDVRVTALPIEDGGKTRLLVVRRDISAQKAAEKRLQIQSTAIEQSPTSVVVTDAQGNIEYVNRHFCRATGYTINEVLGKNPRILKSGETPESTYASMWQTLTSGRVWSGELTNQRKNGEIYWEEAHISPVHNQHGITTHYVGVKVEITERKRAEERLLALNADLENQVAERTRELTVARDRAEEASRAKSAFLSNMSHEIRTPMNSVLGMAYLALKTNPTPRQRDYLQKIVHSGEHLLGIINDILDFSKIEAGMLTVDNTSFDLRLLKEDLESLFAEKAREKGLRFQVEIDPAIPFFLYGDVLRLKQVLINLVGNAFKFTEHGGIGIQLRLVDRQEGKLQIRFEVRDSGIGMTEAQCGELFQSFQQADSSISRKYGGTGLGLAISRQLVELMGGEIGVDSRFGFGSNFWFELPLEQSEEEVTPEEKRQVTHRFAVLQGAEVLLVEDNEFNQQVAAEMLERAGVAVTLANNGREALHHLYEQRYDCVLMDMQMPEMDGLEATRQLRAEPSLADHCVIAMTANASAEDRAACLEAGMDDFISKPIKPDHLYMTVARCLEEHREELTTPPTGTGARAALSPYALASDPEVIDLLVLAERLENNMEDVQRFAYKFLETAQQGLEEIDAALAEKKRETVADVAHRIKAPARTVGAMRFAELCETLEKFRREGDMGDADALGRKLHSNLEVITAHLHSTFAQEVEADAATATAQREEALQVLVVDDEKFQFEFVASMLRQHAITVLHAEDGAQGLELLDSVEPQPDVIICDLLMPGMDGIEFMRNLVARAYEGGIILLSGADSNVVRVARRLAEIHGLKLLGAFEKPVTREALETAISHLEAVGSTPGTQRVGSSDDAVTVEELHLALKRGEIVAHFQPKLALADGQVTGAECLARWHHPERGMVPPGQFITLAEEHGLIDQLTLEMLRQAAERLSQWQAAGFDLKLSVNVSMDNLNRLDLPEIFAETVRAAGVESQKIILELTESRLMDNFSVSLDIIARLRLKGFELSIDDFGTGFSTLQSLKQLPFTELKVDRAFVHGAAQDAAAHAILASSIDLGRTFNLTIVAEGVETEEDLESVRKAGCDLVQGYYFSKPLAAEPFAQWLQQQTGVERRWVK